MTDAAIERDPEFIPDITVLWGPEHRPAVRSFLSGLREARVEELTDEEQDHLEERINRVRDLRDFRFQVIELDDRLHSIAGI